MIKEMVEREVEAMGVEAVVEVRMEIQATSCERAAQPLQVRLQDALVNDGNWLYHCPFFLPSHHSTDKDLEARKHVISTSWL